MRKALLLAIAIALCGMAQAFEFNRMPAGTIKGVRLAYISGTVVEIGVGYGESMGSYWEIPSGNSVTTTGYTLSGLETTTSGVFHYLYVDRANSSFPNVTIRNSTSAPSWSSDFLGWYSGTDRCIGALWVQADGNIAPFICPDDSKYLWLGSINFSPGSIPTSYNTWSLIDISAFTPVNSQQVAARVATYATSVNWSNCRVGIRPESDHDDRVSDGVVRVQVEHWLPYKRGVAKKLEWMAYSLSTSGSLTATGFLQVSIRGYILER